MASVREGERPVTTVTIAIVGVVVLWWLVRRWWGVLQRREEEVRASLSA